MLLKARHSTTEKARLGTRPLLPEGWFALWRYRKPAGILLRVLLAFGLGLLLVTFFCSTTVQATKETKAPPIHTVDGAEIFRDCCASCHGSDGKGNGPAASALRVKVPDLTQISNRAGGEFPTARIRAVIEGTEMVSAHGSRAMPIWGPVFHQIVNDQDLGSVRTANVTRYIESIQRKRLNP